VKCSCGKTEAHEIARRQMADGVDVLLYSDGDVTTRMGIYPKGVGRARSGASGALRAGHLVMEEVCLYDWVEVGRLVHAARRAVEQTFLPAAVYVRRTMAGEKFMFDGRVLVSR
jgi:hypothetical protein